MYHDCLLAILADLEELQANPPIVELKQKLIPSTGEGNQEEERKELSTSY